MGDFSFSMLLFFSVSVVATISEIALELQIIVAGYQSGMSESNRNGRSRKNRKNESGSIEGLPLQLMIMGITTPNLTL